MSKLTRNLIKTIGWVLILCGYFDVRAGRLKRWAWWGSAGFLSLLTLSTVLSFSRVGFYDIILRMDLPAYEMDFLDRMVLLHDYSLAGLFAIPLLAALGLVMASKRYFG